MDFRTLLQKKDFRQLFEDVHRESLLSHDFSARECCKPENKRLNRYGDVYPYDYARVVIQDYPPTDYINASLVKAPRANRQYILCQGPLEHTVGHFWLTIWQQNSKAVLMLNRTREKGQDKCYQYWPLNPGEDLILEDVNLRVDNLESNPGDHYTIRTFKLTNLDTEESREITHFHYTTWPDFGVPKCPDTFLEFLGAVRDSGSLDPDVGPAVIHCSAGIGRSGSFVLVDTVLVLIAKEGLDSVNIKEILLDLRKYRKGLIQTPDQLKFSCLSIAEGARQEGLLSESMRNDLQNQRVAASDSDSDNDSGPPPLPPPRTESLKTRDNNGSGDNSPSGSNEDSQNGESMLSNGNSNSNLHLNGTGDSSSRENSSPETGNGDHVASADANSGSLKKTDSSSSSASPVRTTILNNHKMEERKKDLELRRRRKEDMENRLSETKRKMKEGEEYKNKKKYFYDVAEKTAPFLVGLVFITAGVFYYAYRG